tara:strand:- start:1453 stop:1788 length:336 start_codon:yes stop_codon:yes gene_type:complete
MKIRFRYTYLKTLYKKYKKLKNTATYKGVRNQVKKEMSIVIMSAKSDNKIKKSNIEFHLNRNNISKKPQGFIFAEYNKHKFNSSNKNLRHISESVRKFLIDKIAKERIEKK